MVFQQAFSARIGQRAFEDLRGTIRPLVVDQIDVLRFLVCGQIGRHQRGAILVGAGAQLGEVTLVQLSRSHDGGGGVKAQVQQRSPVHHLVGIVHQPQGLGLFVDVAARLGGRFDPGTFQKLRQAPSLAGGVVALRVPGGREFTAQGLPLGGPCLVQLGFWVQLRMQLAKKALVGGIVQTLAAQRARFCRYHGRNRGAWVARAIRSQGNGVAVNLVHAQAQWIGPVALGIPQRCQSIGRRHGASPPERRGVGALRGVAAGGGVEGIGLRQHQAGLQRRRGAFVSKARLLRQTGVRRRCSSATAGQCPSTGVGSDLHGEELSVLIHP
ncbi:hypothetical protein D3C71_1277160 [compost metagenome]